MTPIAIALLTGLSIALAVLIIIFVLVPVFKGIGWLIGALFQGIGWTIMHVFEFVAGMIGDVLRFIGAIIATIVLVPMTLLNVVIGRWSASGHFADSVKRECTIGATCLYRIALQRPLKLVLLHGLLEGLEQRVPEAMAGAPTADKPKRRTGQFEGYTIVGSLRGGGSGGKLYVAEPDDALKRQGMPDRVVIKSFALTEGSSLPQIVRESRALEAARQLGLVLEHGMEDHRFYYVMPFHDGEHLGIVTRHLHGQTDGRGLNTKQLTEAMRYAGDLLHTLSAYHRGGLWHKDVKPENVIIYDNQAHLVDLGLVTPLRSAMTLTTHGTEYFRDPEMVRQALRGVKVHQIDGAKFDIYAVGAVMYFVLENTFPAHGGLSRFSKKSPEALRWIVKRAMTDYNQRYESSDEMLADLKVVLSASDPYAVKPASLPSMAGGMVAMDAAPDEVAQVFQARSPMPPAAAVAAAGAAAAAAAGAAAAAATPGIPGAVPGVEPRRPKLRVTSWWTGDYVVDDPGTSAVPPAPVKANNTEHRDFRAQARAFRAEAREVQQRVRAGAISARTAAREQVKAARARAQDMRRRAQQRRVSYKGKKQPSPFLAFLVLTVLVGGSIIGAALVRSSSYDLGGRTIVIDPPAIVIGPRIETYAAGKLPVLLVTDLKNMDGHALEHIDEIVDRERKNYNVIIEDEWTEEVYRELMRAWHKNGGVDRGSANAALEELMEDDDLFGVLHVTDNRKGHFNDIVIKSTNPKATKRRRGAPGEAVAVAGPSPVSHASTDLPILVVNDHPAKADPAVEQKIAAVLKGFDERGWNLKYSDDAEVEIRRELPFGPFDPQTFDRDKLLAMVAELELGGVLYIYAGAGDEDSGAGMPVDQQLFLLEDDAVARNTGESWDD